MQKINETFLERDNLVAEYLLDGNANDTAGTNNGAANNITWVWADRGYIEEAGSFNSTTGYISIASNLIPSWVQSYYSFWVKPNSLAWWDAFSSTNPRNIIDVENTNVWFIRFLGDKINVWVNDWSWHEYHSQWGVFTTWEWQFIEVLITPSDKVKAWRNWVLLWNDWLNDTIPATWNSTSNTFMWRQYSASQRYYDWEMSLFRRDTGITEHNRASYLEGLRKLWPTNNTTTVPQDGLIASYDAEDITLDTSGNWNNGTNTNVDTLKIGQQNVWVYNWINADVIISWLDIGNTFTVSFWVNSTQATVSWVYDNATAFGNRSAMVLNQDHTWATVSGQFTLFADEWLTSSRLWPTTNPNINDGGWHMITWTRSSWNVNTICIDWVVRPSTWSIPAWDITSTVIHLWEVFNNSSYYNWKLWLFRIYNTDLSSSEISTLYHEGLTKLSFPNYSLRNLEEWKVLEVSRSASSWTYYDQTGNWNNWTPTSVTDSTNGLYNVMSFNGSNSWIQTPDLISWTTSFSISSMIKFNSVSWIEPITANWASWTNQHLLRNNWWVLQFFLETNIASYQPSWWTLVAWKTYNIIATYDWGVIKAYIDWEEVISLAASGVVKNWTALDWFGRYNTTYLDWQIISPTIYNRALSEPEIQQLYYSSKLI